MTPVLADTSSFHIFPEQASEMAARTDMLFLALMAVSVLVVGIVLALILIGIARRHRMKPQTAEVEGWRSWGLEAGWILATFVVFMGLFVWGAVLYVQSYEEPENPLEIYGTARQWMWQFEYPNGYRSQNDLYVPVNEPVRITLASEDVIHSLFFPAFRVKRDVVPGRYTRFSFTPTKPGEYHLFCNEFCGTGHASMRGTVHVLEPREYLQWTEKNRNKTDLRERGERLFNKHGCSGCHAAGSSIRAPQLDGVFGSYVAVGEKGDLVRVDEAYLRDSILLPQKRIATGYEPIMPAYSGVLDESEVMALVNYIKYLREEDALPPPENPSASE